MTNIRYGVFLRPDAVTCWNVTQITLALKHQFGIVSAGAFPPHATLIGNLRTDASPQDLVKILDPVFAATQPFPVYNAGVRHRETGTYQYDVNLDANGSDINRPFNDVARRVATAVAPVSIDVNDFLVPPVSQYKFAGHMGLASHDLRVDPHLGDEVGEFIAGLGLTPPSSFVARWYSLFEFQSDWDGHWWETLRWRHLHSWDVAREAGQHV